MTRLIPYDKAKPPISIDFDGVLNTYTGYAGDNLGRPRPGAKEFLETLSQEYNITIFSVRPYLKIIPWLREYGLLCYVCNVTSQKERAVAYIDDRGLKFEGDYDECLKQLKDFKPYWEG